MIQNFIINIGSQAGFEIDRTAATHVTIVKGGHFHKFKRNPSKNARSLQPRQLGSV